MRGPERERADASPIRRVALYGPFGHGNLGDAAIQEAMIGALRARIPDVEILGVSLDPANTADIHGIPAVAIRAGRDATEMYRCRVVPARSTDPGLVPDQRPSAGGPPRLAGLRRARSTFRAVCGAVLAPVRVVRLLRTVDVFVVSGGGQISDDWGSPTDHPASMLMWIGCARLAGARVYVVSVGVGPFRRPASVLLFRLALRLAHYRSYRDEESRARTRGWRFAADDAVAPDLAFSLPVAEAAHPDAHLQVVGVSPMSYYAPTLGAWPDQDERRYGRYLKAMADLTRAILADGGSVVCFVSQVRNDLWASNDLRELLADEAGEPPRNLLDEATTGLGDLLAQIATTDVVVTSRLHGVILAYCYGRPVVALSYDPKIRAVMRQFGLEDYCLDIDHATADDVLERLDALRRHPAVGERIRATVESHRQRLEGQYDLLFGPSREAEARMGPT